ncbi:MAG: hypothetical protein ACI89T_001724, partial [Cognaticolwellia sp.]
MVLAYFGDFAQFSFCLYQIKAIKITTSLQYIASKTFL